MFFVGDPVRQRRSFFRSASANNAAHIADRPRHFASGVPPVSVTGEDPVPSAASAKPLPSTPFVVTVDEGPPDPVVPVPAIQLPTLTPRRIEAVSADAAAAADRQSGATPRIVASRSERSTETASLQPPPAASSSAASSRRSPRRNVGALHSITPSASASLRFSSSVFLQGSILAAAEPLSSRSGPTTSRSDVQTQRSVGSGPASARSRSAPARDPLRGLPRTASAPVTSWTADVDALSTPPLPDETPAARHFDLAAALASLEPRGDLGRGRTPKSFASLAAPYGPASRPTSSQSTRSGRSVQRPATALPVDAVVDGFAGISAEVPSSFAQLRTRPKFTSHDARIQQADLIRACQSNDAAKVASLLDQKHTPISFVTPGGQTVFHVAVRHAAVDVLRVLARQRKEDLLAVVNALDADGVSALHYAVVHSSADMVELLLKAGAEPGTKDFAGLSALHLAAKQREALLVSLLVEHGGDIEAPDVMGHSALYWMDPENDTVITGAEWYQRVVWYGRMQNVARRRRVYADGFDAMSEASGSELFAQLFRPATAAERERRRAARAARSAGSASISDAEAHLSVLQDIVGLLERHGLPADKFKPLREKRDEVHLKVHPRTLAELLPKNFYEVRAAWQIFLNSTIDTTGAAKLQQERIRQQGTWLTEQQVQMARSIFHNADKDAAGRIDRLELSDVVEHMMNWQAPNAILFQASINALFNALDVDDSGTIDFDEFLSLYAAMTIDPDQAPEASDSVSAGSATGDDRPSSRSAASRP